jgi:hypothetical protein
MGYQYSTPPKTYAAYRGILLAVLATGVFVFGLFLFPGVLAVAEGLRDAIEAIHESYTWTPF